MALTIHPHICLNFLFHNEDQNGISQACYKVEIYHPGPEPWTRYIVKPVTYIASAFEICSCCNVQTAKVIHLPKNTDLIQTTLGLFVCILYYRNLLKDTFTTIYLFLRRNTSSFTIFSLDLNQSLRVTLDCLHCVICAYLLFIAQR